MSFDASTTRHGRRTPAEIAEDETIAALRGDASRIRFVERLRPTRHAGVTAHSSRLFPVRITDSMNPECERVRRVSRSEATTTTRQKVSGGEK
jgi:hypothetical protein